MLLVLSAFPFSSLVAATSPAGVHGQLASQFTHSIAANQQGCDCVGL
jgi:hypothetical protein